MKLSVVNLLSSASSVEVSSSLPPPLLDLFAEFLRVLSDSEAVPPAARNFGSINNVAIAKNAFRSMKNKYRCGRKNDQANGHLDEIDEEKIKLLRRQSR